MQTKAHRQGIRSYRAQPDRHRHRGLCLPACCPGTVTNHPTIVRLKPALCVVPWRLGAQWRSPFQQFVFALESCSPSPLLSVFSGLLGAWQSNRGVPCPSQEGTPSRGGDEEGQKKASSFERPAQLALPTTASCPSFWTLTP